MDIAEDISIEENEADIHASDELIAPRIMQRLMASIKSIEDVLDYESDMLEQHKNPDFYVVHARKERAIHMLNLICQENPQIGIARSQGMLDDILASLQLKLQRNERILKIHHDAVSDLIEMISESAQARDTDGTYSPFAQA